MAKRTIHTLRAEKNIWLSDLAKKLEMEEAELEAIDKSEDVSDEIINKLIELYSLPEDYFEIDPNSKELRYTPENPVKYFFKVSFVWLILVALVRVVISIPTSILGTFSTEAGAVLNLVSEICNALIVAFSGVYLTAHILKKTSYGKELTKFDFIYPYLPAQVVVAYSAVIGMLNRLLVGNWAEFSGLIFITVTVVGMIIQAYVVAILLNAQINDNKKKCTKQFILISLASIVSLAIHIVYNYYNAKLVGGGLSNKVIISFAVDAVLLVLVLFGLNVGEKAIKKLSNVWLVIFPIAAMVLPTILDFALAFIR